jgi:hypothetical protein
LTRFGAAERARARARARARVDGRSQKRGKKERDVRRVSGNTCACSACKREEEKERIEERQMENIKGCQIFLGPKYQNGDKYTKLPQNIPNGHKIFPMAIK